MCRTCDIKSCPWAGLPSPGDSFGCHNCPTASLSQEALKQRLYGRRPPLPPSQRKLKSGTTSFMLAMHVGAVFALLPRFWSWQALVAFAVLYWVTVIGVTLGLHRLVAHRSFEAPRWLERLLVVMGTLACKAARSNG